MKKSSMVWMTGIMAAAMLAGCGGGADTAAVVEQAGQAAAEVAATTDASAVVETAVETAKAVAEGDFSLLDVSENMVDIGVYGKDDSGMEYVFSMFTGPDGKDYVSLFSFDNSGNKGDVICGQYTAETENIEGLDWTVFDVQDGYTGDTYRLGVVEDESNVAFWNENGDVIEGEYLDASQAIKYMGSAAALLMGQGAASADGAAEASEDDVLNALKSVLTTGFAGASETGEEIYFACDDEINQGILGIVDNGNATFLAGPITEDGNGVLTITDTQDGSSLSFTVQPDEEEENCVILTTTSNNSVAALYAVDASAVLDEMSKY
ncbi:MAG: hypothetical protein IJT34_02715 [Butyrivibrio sp.]|nr:hypothetical protein [Butyrivibrio sp.]